MQVERGNEPALDLLHNRHLITTQMDWRHPLLPAQVQIPRAAQGPRLELCTEATSRSQPMRLLIGCTMISVW